jgi:pimeloyl-ACP methyl ester carboxylesterase
VWEHRAVLPLDDIGDGPAVVLLHAGIADRTMWAGIAGELVAAERRVIAIDLPGYGQAAVSAVDAPWVAVAETLEELDVAGATLVGCSFGGAVALRVAVVAPRRVAALALVSSPGLADTRPSPRLRSAWDAEEAALERGDVDAATAAVVDAWLLPDAPPELVAHLTRMQHRALTIQTAAPDPAAAPDPLEEDPSALTHVHLPALIAVGEHDMPDFHAAAYELARLLATQPPVVIAGAGHLAPLEQPAAFTALLLEFLGRG